VSIWHNLLRRLGFTHPSRLTFEMDQEMVQSLQHLAQREQRTETDLAAELLSMALVRRDAAEAQLQRWQALSPREQQITALVCLGYTNRQIATHLVLSYQTVKTHVRNVLYKFDLRSKAELRQTLAEWDFSAWRPNR
jgi:DNA-binding NarL/FixJ family response regulator